MIENDENNKNLIELMKKTREELDASQEKFAEFIGVARNTVARWENGRLKIPRYIELLLIAINAIKPKEFKLNMDIRDNLVEAQKQNLLDNNFPEDAEFYNKSDLKRKGWTDAMIRDFLSDIEYKEGKTCAVGLPNFNPNYYYLVSKVDEIEKTKVFKERMKAKAARPKV